MKLFKLDYWARKIAKLQFKRNETEMVKEARSIKEEVFNKTQERFIINTNAIYQAQLRDELKSFIRNLDVSDLIVKGILKKEKIFYILNKTLRLKIEIEEV